MRDLPSSLKIATVWLLLATAVFLAVQAWQRHERQTRFSDVDGVIELRRGADGHFRWPGQIDGQAVEFLVDTGATSTALPEALARRLGLRPEGRVITHTAGGAARGWVSRVSIDLDGGLRAERLPVTVLPALASPLLGMDVLSRLHFAQQGGVLRIEPAN